MNNNLSEVKSYFDNHKLIDTKTGENFITQELKKSLFNDGKITKSEVITKNGNINKGFELFDLNDDKKLDKLEWSYFSSGGKINGKSKDVIDGMAFFDHTVKLADIGEEYDDTFSVNDREKVYKTLKASDFMVNNLDKLSSSVKNDYKDILDKVELTVKEDPSSSASMRRTSSLDGQKEYTMNVSKVYDNKSNAGIILHELTHALQLEKGQTGNPAQDEAQAYYMQSVFEKAIGGGAMEMDELQNIYQKFLSVSKDSSLTKGQVATKMFLDNDKLVNQYKYFWTTQRELQKTVYGKEIKEKTNNEFIKSFEQIRYVPIGDINFSEH